MKKWAVMSMVGAAVLWGGCREAKAVVVSPFTTTTISQSQWDALLAGPGLYLLGNNGSGYSTQFGVSPNGPVDQNTGFGWMWFNNPGTNSITLSGTTADLYHAIDASYGACDVGFTGLTFSGFVTDITFSALNHGGNGTSAITIYDIVLNGLSTSATLTVGPSEFAGVSIHSDLPISSISFLFSLTSSENSGILTDGSQELGVFATRPDLVPEPSGLVLAGAGYLVLLAFRRGKFWK